MNLASSSRDMGMSSSSSVRITATFSGECNGFLKRHRLEIRFRVGKKARISPRSRLKRPGGKNRLMKAVRSSSHISIVPSLTSSSYVFASPVVTFNGKFVCGFRNGDCGTGSQSDNTVGSPHGFIIHGIEILKGNEKVMEVIDVENWRLDNSQVLRWIVSLFEWNSFVLSTKSSIQSTFRFR
ncbi:hypothetical protein Tco_0955800 [Tanacetum coccineum]|uniref:Uncharacterized protein n=1 Tax=Tanacetum coccineum TaxID=301880 RepID=A0ABQ5E881_9ASTR